MKYKTVHSVILRKRFPLISEEVHPLCTQRWWVLNLSELKLCVGQLMMWQNKAFFPLLHRGRTKFRRKCLTDVIRQTQTHFSHESVCRKALSSLCERPHGTEHAVKRRFHHVWSNLSLMLMLSKSVFFCLRMKPKTEAPNTHKYALTLSKANVSRVRNLNVFQTRDWESWRVERPFFVDSCHARGSLWALSGSLFCQMTASKISQSTD